jgi:folate-binding protein YgfZ
MARFPAPVGRLSSQGAVGTVEVMSETTLHAHLASRGAIHADDRGVLLPRHFGDPQAEYRALTGAAAAVDLGYRTIVRASGPDRLTFLQGMLTNDVAQLAPGTGCPALLLTIQGRVTADVRVAALPDELLLEVDVRARDELVAALEALLVADDVELHAVDDTALIGLDGPQAAGLLGLPDLAPFAHRELELQDTGVRAVRASEVHGAGFVLHVAAAHATQVWDALVARGARPCGMAAVEGRRVEVGVPRIGLDMGAKTLALEVPVEGAISATKGCYLGQEVVARGTARGHVNRRLVPLLLDGPPPATGDALLRDGKEVGHLTTVARAFGAGSPAALGFVRREHWEPGTELAVSVAGTTRARVASWPLA